MMIRTLPCQEGRRGNLNRKEEKGIKNRMSEERVVLVVENDKKRAGLAVFLSGLGIEVEVLTALPETSAVPGLAIGLSALIAALRGEKAAKENLRRLKKDFSLHLRRSRELEEAYDTTLENFMAALDLRDVETYGHSKTVARYSHVLAEAIGVRDPRALDSIRKGALLHDSGKMAIPDSILKKPGPLTAKEWEVIRRHPALGYGLVRDVKLVSEVGNIILCHHEKYDGTGYPKGLKGEAIPLEARVFAVADTLDAVTSHRPYRAPRDFRVARRELVENAGKQFDPKVVDVFCGMDLAVWEKIRFETTRLLPPIEDYRPPVSKK
ncbi:MAG: HD-GYP domain-containing protein [Acidobacteria bacterium]|nr:HD-GYP domain-containing protein [Acidobacteriota bacterium]